MSIAEQLRTFASFLDDHPVLEEIPEVFAGDIRLKQGFGRHLVGKEAALLDRFAEIHGAVVEHKVHSATASEPGARYSQVATVIDGTEFRLQAHTADYEAATGKTIESGKDTPK